MSTVKFDPDQRAVLLKNTKDMMFAAKELHERISKDDLEANMSTVLPSLLESYFIEISKGMDYETHLVKEHEERHQEIRKANQRIRELEERLASDKPIDGLKEQLKYLHDFVYAWWSEVGFRHVSDISFVGYGNMKIEFSFTMDTWSDSWSDTPETDREKKVNKIKMLREQGYDLQPEEKGSRTWQVMDTPNNRKLLAELLTTRFPSINITKMESWCRGRGNQDVWTMWRMEAIIYDLHDIVREAMKG